MGRWDSLHVLVLILLLIIVIIIIRRMCTHWYVVHDNIQLVQSVIV